MAPEKRINVQIFTDGSCFSKGALKPGGFGVYCLAEGREVCLRRGYWNTTTSRMEMMALLSAVQMVDSDTWTKVHIISDSQFVVNAFKDGSLSMWRMSGWLGVKNSDLWKQIVKEIDSRRKMLFGISWMNGHGKDLNDPMMFGNACADALANYKTQDSYTQDKPLEGLSWFHHEGSDSIFIEKTERYEEMNRMGDLLLLGDCFYATEEELIDRLNGTALFNSYYNGKFDVDLKIEKI